MKAKYPSNLSIVAWVHSQVQGMKCLFSSLDVHTQFKWSKINPDFLGLVFELDPDGSMLSYDFFGLTRQGNVNLNKCKLPHNQCDKCGKKSNYTSLMHLVNLFDGPLYDHDFTSDITIETEDQLR